MRRILRLSSIRGERAGLVAGLKLHVAEPVEAHRHVALRLRVPWVEGDQLAVDVEALLIRGERAGLVAGLKLHMAELV